ncbi:MAG: aldo/keto reductase [Gammaproteobacteria bacterium]|nr:aldo/keto reductase [Gammaproteobacteria bacterium]
MRYRKLGRTGIDVSQICLGSMTWGSQNSEQQAHEQMDYAVEQGINLFDTAEMYPTTPSSAESQGRTEAFIGSWFKKSGKRSHVILATKVTGQGLSYIQNGIPINAKKIRNSIEGSLRRLQTSYIDLYQLHWPNRGSYHFRQNWNFDPTQQDREQTRDNMLEVLQTMQALIDEGKIRHVGLSNESCWGTSQYLDLATQNNLPRVVSIQNEYSLLCRLFDLDLAELSYHEDVGLLAYSPLSAGMLTGKYRNGAIPEGSRRSMNKNLFNRYTSFSEQATNAYLEVAEKHGLDPSQMALAFCMSRPFMTSVIIGATSMLQLKTDIGAAELELDKNVMEDIEKVYRRYPLPM